MEWRTPDQLLQDMLAQGGWSSLVPTMTSSFAERFAKRCQVLQAMEKAPVSFFRKGQTRVWTEDIPRNGNAQSLQRLLDALAEKAANKLDEEILGELLHRKLDLFTREEMLEWLRAKKDCCITLMRQDAWYTLRGDTKSWNENNRKNWESDAHKLVISGHVPSGMLVVLESKENYFHHELQLGVSKDFFSPKLQVKLDWAYLPSPGSRAAFLLDIRKPMSPL